MQQKVYPLILTTLTTMSGGYAARIPDGTVDYPGCVTPESLALVEQSRSFGDRLGVSSYFLALLLVLAVYSAIRLVLAVVRTSRLRVSTGREGMIGETGVVRRQVSPRSGGMVFVHGELWKAYPEDTSIGSLEPGTEVEVVGFKRAAIVIRAVEGGN